MSRATTKRNNLNWAFGSAKSSKRHVGLSSRILTYGGNAQWDTAESTCQVSPISSLSCWTAIGSSLSLFPTQVVSQIIGQIVSPNGLNPACSTPPFSTNDLVDSIQLTPTKLLRNQNNGSPNTRLSQSVEKIGQLPRRQQAKILDVVDALLAQQGVDSSS